MNARGEYGTAVATPRYATPYLVVSGIPLTFVLGLVTLALGGVAWWAYERSKKAGDQALRTASDADRTEDPQTKEALARQAFELAANARAEASAQQAASEARRATGAQALRATQQAAAEAQRLAAAAAEARRATGAQAIRATQQAAAEARRVAADVRSQLTDQAKVAMWRAHLDRMAALGVPAEEVIKQAEAALFAQKASGVWDALKKAARQVEAEKLAAAVSSGWRW